MITKLKKIALYSLLFLLLNSCSLAYFVSKDQKVTLIKDPKATVLIEKKEPQMNKNKDKYILQCDGNAKQVTIKKDGYKTINKVFVPYNLSPAAYGTIAINAAAGGIALYLSIKNSESGAPPMLFGALGTVIGGVWGAGVAAFSPEFYRFNRTIHLDKDSFLLIPTRDSLMKEIKLNKVGVDIKPENMEEYYPTYSEYLKGKYTKKYNVKGIDATKIEDTYFSDELNTLLKKSGFVDTSRLVLKSSYNQNTFLDATIIGFKNIEVINSSILTNTGLIFIKVDLKIKWDVLDYYKNIVYSDTIDSKSGEFLSSYTVTTTAGSTITSTTVGKSSYLEDATRDAIETGLYTLMNKSKFKSFLKLDKVDNQDTLAVMELKKTSSNVSSIEQAVQASVTVKTKNGHGSGFFISEDGFIVTNYHVVSDSAKVEVIMNNGVKYPAKIVRVNKTSDLALLKIEKNGIVPFDFSGKNQPAMGNEIYVIGTPSAEDLSQTLSKGIISSIRKQANGSIIIQTDASISLGNSGGPIIEKGGNLLGIVNAKLVGMGIEGISFAIPSSVILPVLNIVFK